MLDNRLPNMFDEFFDVCRRRVAGIDDEVGVFRRNLGSTNAITLEPSRLDEACGMIASRFCHLHPRGRNVIQVVVAMFAARQLPYSPGLTAESTPRVIVYVSLPGAGDQPSRCSTEGVDHRIVASSSTMRTFCVAWARSNRRRPCDKFQSR